MGKERMRLHLLLAASPGRAMPGTKYFPQDYKPLLSTRTHAASY